MRPVCVICTELFVVNSHISACTCGHIFHEECLFRWLRSSQQTCPQCRAKVKEANVIKRLYLTEADNLPSTQSFSTDNLNKNPELITQKYEELLNKVQELKSDLKEKSDNLSLKSKIIEQKDSKVRELEDFKTNNKKKLTENQLLIDYLKKELEHYTKIKEQYDLREKSIFELESKLREFRSIELIYKEHEDAFANEMKKYIDSTLSSSHLQSIVRQLVSTNVLLKEHLDKQTEDKKALRKKVIQMEKTQSEKDKFISRKEAEMNELSKRLVKVENELKIRTSDVQNFTDSETTRDSDKDSLRLDSPRVRSSLSNDDSDIQYLDDIGRFETSFLRKKKLSELESDSGDDSHLLTPLPFSKKRKNPFLKSESNESDNEESDEITDITPYQTDFSTKFLESKKLALSQTAKNEKTNTDDILLVKPITNLVKGNRLYKTASFSSGQTLANKNINANTGNSRSSEKLNDSIEMKPLNRTGFTFDGLGGRQKAIKSENLKSYFSSSTSSSKMSKFKVT